MSKNRETKLREAQSFESSLRRLEQIVREMESGELPLERSLELFEQGVKLSRECQTQLDEAERRIEVLLRDADGRLTTRRLAVEETDDEIDAAVDDDDDDDEEVF